MLELKDIIICDDHPISALGVEVILRDYLAKPLSIRIAHSAQMTFDLINEKKPDLCVLDLGLPDMSGVEIIKQVKDQSKFTKIIILTGQDDPNVLHKVLSLKVNGILRKNNSVHNLIDALNFLENHKGDDSYIDSASALILQTVSTNVLTIRETEVLELMAEGLTSEQISQKLDCALSTIKTYRARIMQKSASRNSAEMVAWFLKRNSK